VADLQHLVALGTAHLPDALAPGDRRRRFARVPGHLPDIFTIGTFECRLDADDRVDFQACAPRQADASVAIRAWLAACGKSAWPSRGHRATAALLREWIEPAGLLAADIAAVWVEIDLEDGVVPFPFPFLTLTPPWARAAPRPLARTLALADAGLAVLTDGTLDARIRAAVRDCLRALPPQASLLHVAMRPMPGGDVARLIAATPWALIPGFLARLHWPEPIDRVRGFLQRYCRDTLINSIQLDVGRGLAPRLGLEVYYPTPPEDPRWQRLFDLLVADGACIPARRDAVCAWPMRDAVGETVLRELLVKIVYEVDRPPRAKAYLPYGQAAEVIAAGTRVRRGW
jgi:hypothetical protein